jgi:chromosome segregation ATPase
MSELAETLRAIVESADAMQKARAALPEGYELWNASRARDYLRGYDDAKAEMDPYIAQLERRNEELEMLLRESNDEIANAKARVRELEAQIAALAQALGEVG